MTNPNWSEIARSLNTIAEGLAALSIALEAAGYTYETSDQVADDVYDASELPPDEPARTVRRTSAAKPPDRTTCPAHGAKWRRGRYGSYCPERSDDPSWSNEKGYCTVTPANAPEYLESIGASL